ncbi:MAG: hypothetical protein ACLUDF_05780 [Butyricicoccus sp.]
MLKLLKYEWKACARTCLPLYGVLILMSLISRMLYVIPKNASLDFMLPAIGSMLYMGVMMAAFVVTAVILIQRFYKNLLGSEGYLMFTLPVTVTQHLLSVSTALQVLMLMVMMGVGNAVPQPFVDLMKVWVMVTCRWAQRSISCCGSAAYSRCSVTVYFLVTRWILV